ncbi:FRG domain-containing protein [Amedibacterium intestinale]|uniref:FRG domain-containing protein n=1 Tax=Amedibacterium intestinale TaxID=2583452 RepID=UPI0013002DBF
MHKNPNFESTVEIQSVGDFITKIKELNEQVDGESTDFYFRGQETEYWDIEPSIFRDDMLSIEHKLIQIPLQKIPSEFKDSSGTFDLMAKYQHYGMCTRLLDLTTNPLVALYFACKLHGPVDYYDGDDKLEKKEPYGVIYYKNSYYPFSSTDREIRIVSSLAKMDLSKENTINDVLDKLVKEKVIDNEMKKRWLSKEEYKEFINIIQRNYLVIPSYSNERLRKQSGVFLIAGAYSVNMVSNIGESIITKCKDNLKKEFERTCFIVPGDKKEDILNELDLYNINEATLFPELEHQLNYIKNFNRNSTTTVNEFLVYDDSINNGNTIIISESSLNDYILSNLNLITGEAITEKEIESIKRILSNNMIVDWYKRETVLSKIKMNLIMYYKKEYKNKSRQDIDIIVDRLIENLKLLIDSYSKKNNKGD